MKVYKIPLPRRNNPSQNASKSGWLSHYADGMQSTQHPKQEHKVTFSQNHVIRAGGVELPESTGT